MTLVTNKLHAFKYLFNSKQKLVIGEFVIPKGASLVRPWAATANSANKPVKFHTGEYRTNMLQMLRVVKGDVCDGTFTSLRLDRPLFYELDKLVESECDLDEKHTQGVGLYFRHPFDPRKARIYYDNTLDQFVHTLSFQKKDHHIPSFLA